MLLILKKSHKNKPFQAFYERSHFIKYLYECLNHDPTENIGQRPEIRICFVDFLSMRSTSPSDYKTSNVNVQTYNVSNKIIYKSLSIIRR